MEAFSSSEEAFTADALFAAYSSGSADKVKACVSAKGAFKQLDNQVRRAGGRRGLGWGGAGVLGGCKGGGSRS